MDYVTAAGVIVGLIALEFSEHDSFSVQPNYEPKQEMYNRISKRLDGLKDYSVWRRALVAALIASAFSTLILYHRLPSVNEWLVFGGVTFLIVYMIDSWFKYHYIYYNVQVIEAELHHFNSLK